MPAELLTLLPMPRAKGTLKPPLMLEFAVNPETAPVLVTTSRSLVWVTPKTAQVRAATQVISPVDLFGMVVDTVASTGRKAQWGNTHPITAKGVQDAVAYVQSYGFTELEILCSVNWRLAQETGLPCTVVSWLPEHTFVVLPVDRSYVGFAMQDTATGLMLAVVHNACRGIAVIEPLITNRA